MRNVAKVDENGPVGVVAVLSFVCEVGMLALLVWAGWRLGGSTITRVLLAIAFPAVAIAIWALWMAPNSSTRLHDPVRLIAQILLFAAVGAVVAIAGQRVLGIGFAVAAVVIFALSRSVA